MKTQVANPTLADVLDQHTVNGSLWHREDDRIRCVACGHRCLIGEGKRGICKVRYNEAGELRVPFGYVAGLQCDPVEKKPFFHVHPGSDALTFGMMGCDLHCSYCFTGDTVVITDRGPMSLADVFALASRVTRTADAEVAFPELRAIAASGTLRKIRGVFKHAYHGKLTVIQPYYLPELRCTPDHRVYATMDPRRPPQPTPAGELTAKHYLAIPRAYAFSTTSSVNVEQELSELEVTYRVPWELSAETRQIIAEATAAGKTSREIGAALGKHPLYIRHVRSKIRRGRAVDTRSSGPIVEGDRIRFPNEHRPGTQTVLPLDVDLARLLGVFCAEGCVTRCKNRPNSFTLNFSFAHGETHLANEVAALLQRCFGVRVNRVRRDTTLGVSVSKASVALLFKQLAGSRATRKRVPQAVFEAPREIIAAFLDAYWRGDGHCYPNGKTGITTVSRELAYGIAWLVLKLGEAPSVYDAAMPPAGTIQGRAVNRAPHQYSVVWYPGTDVKRKIVETDEFHLVPIRDVSFNDCAGDVFNMEVEEEHNYLAGFFLVCNCQNWVTSQALRDSAAVAPIRELTREQLVGVAQRERARLVVSSYNEPLITAEWAVAVFERAKAAGLDCAFVSNGNATPEVLDYLKPWIVAYKVDLKSFDDQHYRSLGGTLGNITETIRMIHDRGIWLEVVTLIIPGFNDREDELREMARFLASIDRNIPWHVTAFHKDYRMTDPDATPPRTLMRAAEIGTEEGLRFIYAGNLPGQVGPWENTRCPSCQEVVIERYGYLIRAYRLTADGCCPRCRTPLPGIWPGNRDAVRTGNDRAAYMQRLPRAVSVSARPMQSLPLVEGGDQRDFSGGTPAMATAALAATTRAPGRPQRPEMTADQKQCLIDTARALVRDLTRGQPAEFADPSLAGLGETLVAGAFVSLKRGKHLRSCCGMLGQPVPLRTALQNAAERTVWEDVRFPPVSPTEVDHLHMEVWVLHSPEPVRAAGAARADAITIGKHGIQVIRGTQHGLFLPSVALDNAWDSKRFLDQVCIKAGLHPTAWQDEGTALFVFEGEVLHARIAEDAAVCGIADRRPALCTLEDLRTYVNFCCDNIGAVLSGATPSHYVVGAPDGSVNGVILALRYPTPAGSETTHLCQISLRPGLPLQATLFQLCQNAAQVLAAQRLGESLATVQVGLSILHDPVLHGTVADADLAGVDPRHRALLVMERNKSAVVFDPSRAPADLLAEAATAARVHHPAGAAVFSLDALARHPFTASTAPRPVAGPATRPAAAAGTFYPADAAQLGRMVDSLLEGERKAEPWPAAMVPHAGLIYSGRLAANVLKRIRIPRTVIVLGPKHTPFGMDWAVAPHETWTFPGGQLASDLELAHALARAIPGLELDAAAHQREHGVEVELPLLAGLAPATRVVGIAIGTGDLAACRRFAAGLAGVVRQCDEQPLLLVSSDMNHYATDAENRRLDAMALAALDGLDPAAVYETVTDNHISMCGVLPAVIVLEALRLLGGGKMAERVGYATSADVSGDTSRVVGYAGMLFG